MIYISKEKISTIKKEKYPINLANEIFAAFVINYYIEAENIILDDKPDLHNVSKSTAYEIVRCDLYEDLELRYVLEAVFENNFNYEKTISDLEKNKKTDLLKFFCILKGKDGTAIGAQPFMNVERTLTEPEKIMPIGPRAPYYYLPIFCENINKKLEKLNNNAYLPYMNVSLVILSTSRFKSEKDAKKIFDLFVGINNANTKKYTNLYLITTSGLYFLVNKNINFIEFSSTTYNELVSITKNLILNIKNQDSLYTEHPEIACEWHRTKNKEILPYNVPVDFDKKVWWKCPKGHSYQMKVKSRTLLKNKCPICS